MILRRQNEMKILGFDFNTYLKFENIGNMEILGFDFDFNTYLKYWRNWKSSKLLYRTDRQKLDLILH